MKKKIKQLLIEYQKQADDFADLINDYKANDAFQEAQNARIRMFTINSVIDDLEKL